MQDGQKARDSGASIAPEAIVPSDSVTKPSPSTATPEVSVNGVAQKSASLSRRSRFSEQLSPPQTSAGAPGRKSSRNLEEEDERGLAELDAPAPTRREAPYVTGRRYGAPRTLERQGDQGLTELAAPKPDPERTEDRWRGSGHLENGKFKPSEETRESHSMVATQIYITSYLVFFSILGVLARIGIQWLTFYPGVPIVFSNIWANFAGTLFMGFLSEDQRLFREEWGRDRWKTDVAARRLSTDSARAKAKSAHGKAKKTIPLFIGLTTGFCGSFTSFSTFMRDSFFAISNNVATPINHPNDPGPVTSTISRRAGYSFEAVMAIIVITVTVNIAALHLGAHIALGTARSTPTLPFRIVRKFIDPLFVFLGFGCWIGAIIMAILPPDRPGGPVAKPDETWRGQALFAVVFAPLGCLLRFILALKLNGVISWFPLGTFTANIFGTAVFGMGYDLQRTTLFVSSITAVGGGRLGCQVLQGLQDGFCGALTTVSTWILELTTLSRKHAYWYGATSILVGLSSIVVIMGSVSWSIGFGNPACVVEVS